MDAIQTRTVLRQETGRLMVIITSVDRQQPQNSLAAGFHASENHCWIYFVRFLGVHPYLWKRRKEP
jgi:hypothetical protein